MTIAWKAPAAAVFCTFALLGCQANSGPVGGGGGGGLDPDTGIDADGNPTGDGSNTDTGFPNDGSVGGSILDEGVELIGGDTGQGFICTQAASADAGAEIEVATNLILFGLLLGAEHAGGHGGDQQPTQQAHARILAVVQQPRHRRHQAPEVAPEVHDHRQQRAKMHGHIEGQRLVRPAQQPGGQHQVPRAGDRQKFRQALNQAEYGRLQRIHRRSHHHGATKVAF